ncbi:hypothetical protein [Alteraurantiacibacter aquimixticola]|uniref:Uncharacterized protein n=1 Tax=Alteraurantiacibacter aquimixticola TaxID=2489173 RepID=A0A4T3F5B1_9SPHN|nr:hypothetical protein [Alteraurantiacibacter aquimixticola]TIX52041.1 hypothetical protein E5222_06345 [Alteraurantiacibacter aquimixticola]
MLRQLLTLLAVLSGLTATVAPAHALDAGVQVVEVAQDSIGCQPPLAILAEATPSAFHKESDAQQVPCPRPLQRVVAPAIVLKADRARE